MLKRFESRALVLTVVIAGCAAATVATNDDASTSSGPASAAASAEANASAEPVVTAEPTAAPETASVTSTASAPKPGTMADHFAQTVVIRDAVIWGKLKQAVKPAQNLASMDVKKLPQQWHVSMQQLQAAAKRIMEGSDVQEVAAATADIARACGHCHGAAGGPKITPTAPPDPSGSVAARMKRHRWAMDRLWEGLYGPSPAAWTAGASALELDPFSKEVLEPGGVHAKSAAATFNADAKALAKAKTADDRASAYAKMISSCAPCHEALKVQPTPTR